MQEGRNLLGACVTSKGGTGACSRQEGCAQACLGSGKEAWPAEACQCVPPKLKPQSRLRRRSGDRTQERACREKDSPHLRALSAPKGLFEGQS